MEKYPSDEYDVYSVGIKAHGLNPNAIKAMKEVDIDISINTSNIIDRDILNNADLVITLRDDAKGSCPMIPPHRIQAKTTYPNKNKTTAPLICTYTYNRKRKFDDRNKNNFKGTI